MTSTALRTPHARTDRLDLYRPTTDDVDEVYEICSDPRSWTHFPSLRHTERRQSEEHVGRWLTSWESAGLGSWAVRARDQAPLLGFGGCTLRHGVYWNVGYRIAPAAWGNGYATELAREAIAHARAARPEVPVVAYLLEHNLGSAAVARKLDLTLVHRGPDAGNPDPAAVRLVFADRPLSEDQLAATMA